MPTLPRNQRHPSSINETVHLPQCTPDDQAPMTVYRVQSPHATTLTTQLVQTLLETVATMPADNRLGGFGLTRALITLERRGALIQRIPRCTWMKLWCPVAILHPVSDLSDFRCCDPGEAIHALLTGLAAAITLPAFSWGIRVDPRLVVILYDIGRQPASTPWLLRGMPADGVLNIFKRCPLIKSNQWRDTVRGAIQKYLKKSWNISPGRWWLCKTACTPIPNAKRLLRNIVHSAIGDSTAIPISLRDTMFQRLRIVIEKPQTVSRVLCNVISECRKFVIAKPPTCACGSLRHHFRKGVTSTPGHLQTRGVKTTTPSLQQIFNISATTGVVAMGTNLATHIATTVKDMYGAARDWLGTSVTYATPNAADTNHSIATGRMLLPSWPNTLIAMVVNAAEEIGVAPSSATWFALQECYQSLASPHVDTRAVTLTHTINAKTMLEGAIISPLDRNQGQLYVLCPQLFHAELCKMFALHKPPKTVTFSGTTASVPNPGSTESIPGYGFTGMAIPFRTPTASWAPAERYSDLCLHCAKAQRPYPVPANCFIP